MKIIIVLTLIINTVYAIDVKEVSKGTPAPYDGFFVDKDNMKEIIKKNEERKRLKKEVITLEEIGTLKDTKNKVLKEVVEEQQKEIGKTKFRESFKGIFGFLLGVGITGLASYATIKYIK